MEGVSAQFDFSDKSESPHYFKSSFARMMAVESKSLDYASFRKPKAELERATIFRHSSAEEPPQYFNDNNMILKSMRPEDNNNCQNGGSRGPWSTLRQGGTDSDVVLLRKECQCLLEENRRLRSTDCSGLQQQVDTLHWQLRQNEASRKMHRQVLEQVAKFLDHTHRTLDTLDQGLKEQNRVVRSHSVYSVAGSAGHKMADRLSSNTMANTIHGHQDYAAFQDFTWRRNKKPTPTGADAPEKLSKEAFRLLRTVQSLLGTCDPDLVSVSRGNEGASNIVEQEPSIVEEDDHFQAMSPMLSSTPMSGHDITGRPSASSASSNEDESGFSSMGSFQEVGLPSLPPQTHHHRRWSSSPLTPTFVHHDRLHVLWV